MFVSAAVKQYGMALQLDGEDMKNNKHVVIAAVKQYGTALKFVGDDLKNSETIVMAAVQQKWCAFWANSTAIPEMFKRVAEYVMAIFRRR